MKCLVRVEHEFSYDEWEENVLIVQAKDLEDLKEKLRQLVNDEDWYEDGRIKCFDLVEVLKSVNDEFEYVYNMPTIFEVDLKYNYKKLFDK